MGKLVAVIDCETDPFMNNRIPKPFCVEFHSDKITRQFWGHDCILQLVNFLETLQEEYFIYAHNGGKFDFLFMAEYLDNPIKIINSRIVSAALFQHTMRDSYAIIPVPLRDYEKETFDYSKMESDVREKFKTEILDYLHSDCMYLLQIVSAFVERFGPKLTVGSTAIKELRKRHEFERLPQEKDAIMRPFYYGGRVECFRGGIIPGPWKVYDVNSMYPKAMRDFNHPANGTFIQSDELPADGSTYFIHFRGKNNGALPIKTKLGLDFNIPEGDFFACSHEMEIALKYGLVEIDEIYCVYEAVETISFDTFVNDFYAEKVNSKLAGDKRNEMFAKFMLNSAYGKFGQNPENFEDFIIEREFGKDFELREQGYTIKSEYPTFEIWAKPSLIQEHSFYDVSIAASITSAARSILLEAIQKAVEPIYCDTDSLICRELNCEISSSVLGAWKFEGQFDYAAIGGKKLYAMYNKGDKSTKKLASKGGTLTLQDIKAICKGETVLHRNIAPTMAINSSPKFISRNFKATIDINNELLQDLNYRE